MLNASSPGAFAQQRRGSNLAPCCCFGPCAAAGDGDVPISHPPADQTGYRAFVVGDVKVFPLQDATGAMSLDRVFPEADPAGEVAPWLNAEGNLQMSFGCTLLQSDGLNILCDTSCGDVVQPAPQPPHRHLPELLLSAAGLLPEDIDIVTYSHAHADHVAGGIVRDLDSGGLVPTFPNARYLIRERELAHQVGTETYATFFSPLEAAGRLETIASEGDYVLTSDIMLQSGFEGHTPGLQVTRIGSKGRGAPAYFIGDALHVLLQFGMPHYSPSFDFDIEKSVPARQRLLDKIQAEGALLLSPHLPFPGVGHVVGAGATRSFAPLALPAAEGRL